MNLLNGLQESLQNEIYDEFMISDSMDEMAYEEAMDTSVEDVLDEEDFYDDLEDLTDEELDELEDGIDDEDEFEEVSIDSFITAIEAAVDKMVDDVKTGKMDTVMEKGDDDDAFSKTAMGADEADPGIDEISEQDMKQSTDSENEASLESLLSSLLL